MATSKSKQTSVELEPYMIDGPKVIVKLPPDKPDMPRTNTSLTGKITTGKFKPNKPSK